MKQLRNWRKALEDMCKQLNAFVKNWRKYLSDVLHFIGGFIVGLELIAGSLHVAVFLTFMYLFYEIAQFRLTGNDFIEDVNEFLTGIFSGVVFGLMFINPLTLG